MGKKSLCDPEGSTVNPKQDWGSPAPLSAPPRAPLGLRFSARGTREVTEPPLGPIPSLAWVSKCQSQVRLRLSNTQSQNNDPNH